MTPLWGGEKRREGGGGKKCPGGEGKGGIPRGGGFLRNPVFSKDFCGEKGRRKISGKKKKKKGGKVGKTSKKRGKKKKKNLFNGSWG